MSEPAETVWHPQDSRGSCGESCVVSGGNLGVLWRCVLWGDVVWCVVMCVVWYVVWCVVRGVVRGVAWQREEARELEGPLTQTNLHQGSKKKHQI